MSKFELDGIVSVIPTPFTKDEEIDKEGLERLVEFAVAAGVAGVCLPAYGSEFYKLSEDERIDVIRIAALQARGRIPVLGQSNHGSAKIAGDIAKKNEANGADIISFALPRQFAVPEENMLRYAERVCNAVKLPVLIQDFNPGGATAGPAFCKELQQRCSNFLYVKLEEPVMGPKVRAIRAATEGKLGVLEGWGGLYMTELFEFGICGLMPGTGLADLLQHVWRSLKKGARSEAMDTFEKTMPLISFSLQSFEMFHFVEKRLLQKRGAMCNTYARDVQWSPSAETISYTDELVDRVLNEADRLGLKRKLV